MTASKPCDCAHITSASVMSTPKSTRRTSVGDSTYTCESAGTSSQPAIRAVQSRISWRFIAVALCGSRRTARRVGGDPGPVEGDVHAVALHADALHQLREHLQRWVAGEQLGEVERGGGVRLRPGGDEAGHAELPD